MSFVAQTFESVPVETTYVYQSGGSLGSSNVVSGETVTTYTYTSSSSSGGAVASSSSGQLADAQYVVVGGSGSNLASASGQSAGAQYVIVGGASGSSSNLASASGQSGGAQYVVVGGGSGSSGSNLASNLAQQAVASSITNDVLNTNVTVISSQSGTVSGGSSSVSLEASAFSQLEQAILRANNPFEINESETITVNGQTGIWANKQEVLNWRGVIPITQYVINEDANPEIIRKRTEQVLTYEQEIAIRYLRPPTPPPPGEIVIRQEKNIVTPPAPPLVIRQQPPRPETPAPLIIREAPPRPPAAIGQKVVTISGKRLPPPPRKVIIERLAPLPNKPQSYIIERWLPYSQTKRRVIFQKPTEADPVIPRPRNVIVQWEAPEVRIKKEFKDLGVIRANPVEYVQRYGATLKQHVELPDFVRQIRPPTGVVLAAEFNAPSLFELEGDVQALSLIDLDREGLGEYKAWLARFGFGGSVTGAAGGSGSGSGSGFGGGSGSGSASGFGGGSGSGSASGFGLGSGSVTGVTVTQSVNVSVSQVINAIAAELFSGIDTSGDARVSVSEAENLIIKLNQRLGRTYSKEDSAAFFRRLDSNRDGQVSFAEFRNALLGQFVSN